MAARQLVASVAFVEFGERCGFSAPGSFPDDNCYDGSCDPETHTCKAWCDL